MANTPTFGLFSPDGVNGIDNILADMAAMQVSVESALTTVRNSITTPTVASSAARDALFPVPVQGNRVFRADMGWEESYFVATASNPTGGSVTSGWYPISGAMPKYAIYRNVSSPLSTGVWTNWQWVASTVVERRGGFSVDSGQPTRILVPYRGWYDVTFKMDFANGVSAGSERMVRIDSDGPTPFNNFQQIDRVQTAVGAGVTKSLTVQVLATTYITTGGYHSDPGSLNGVNPQVNITFRQPAL